MTQPNLPDVAAQQQAAVEVFAQYEPPLYEAYLEMMLEWLAAVRGAMFAGGVVSLGLVPDPLAVFAKTPMWNDLADKYSEEVAREVLAAPYKNLFADGTLFQSRPFVRNWIAARANRLQNVPNEVYGLVQHVIDSGTTNGASIPDVTKQVQDLFDATDVQTWKNRARTVARTEVVGAYNGGLYDAFSMVVEADPETPWVKRWLATEDHRTRPDHKEADGQVVPWGQPFTVGEFAMMYPHDPEAPPQEVVNCRCTMLLEVAGEPTDMSNRGYKDSLTAGFNPLEKRDKDGKWTKGGSLLKSLVKKGGKPAPVSEAAHRPAHVPVPEPEPVQPTGRPLGTLAPSSRRRNGGGSNIIGIPEDWSHQSADPRFDSAKNGEAALKQFTPMNALPGGQSGSASYYSDEGFDELNHGLGRAVKYGKDPKDVLSPVDYRAMTLLDQATAPKAREHDVVLWRGIREADKKFGKAWGGDPVGMEWTQKGFSSTSADFGVAAGFTRSEPNSVLMRVLLPKDAKTGGIDMRSKGNFNAHEAEALLARNMRFRVVADHGLSKSGYRLWDVEVVS